MGNCQNQSFGVRCDSITWQHQSNNLNHLINWYSTNQIRARTVANMIPIRGKKKKYFPREDGIGFPQRKIPLYKRVLDVVSFLRLKTNGSLWNLSWMIICISILHHKTFASYKIDKYPLLQIPRKSRRSDEPTWTWMRCIISLVGSWCF